MNFLVISVLQALLASSCVEAVHLYVAADIGNGSHISTLSLTHTPQITSPQLIQNGFFAGSAPEQVYDLSVISDINATAQGLGWLTLNSHNNVLILTDGVTTGNGTVTSFRTSASGELTKLDSVECLLDGVFASFFAHGKYLAVPHYTSSGLQTYNITADGVLTPLQTFTYTMSAPGPNAVRQAAPHPHEAILDPTGQYLLVIDLGADLVRVYSIDQDTGLLTALTPLNAAPGSGPRHGVFTQDPVPQVSSNATSNYVFYLGAEIAGTVTAYSLTYLPDGQGLQFDELPDGNYTSLAPGVAFPSIQKGVTAEPRLSPDGNFLVVSNRRDNSFTGTTEQYPPNGTSDSIVTFRVRQDLGGLLDFVQTVPAGGAVPRAMALNAAGNLAAVGLEFSEKVTILERDIDSGMFIGQVAEVEIPGEIFAVIWDE